MEKNLFQLSKEDQEGFFNFFLEKDKNLFALVILVASIQYAIFLPIEMIRGFEGEQIFYFRIGGAILYFIIYLIIKYGSFNTRSFQWYGFVIVFIVFFYSVAQDYFAVAHPYFLSNAMVVIVIFNYIGSGLHFAKALIANVIIFTVYVVYAEYNKEESPVLASQIPSLVSNIGFIAYAGYLIQKYKWAYYSKFKQLDREKEKFKELSTFKDRLFGVLAHDFKSPLLSLKNMLDLLKSKILQHSDLEDIVSELSSKVSHASEVTAKLLERAENQMDDVEVNPNWFVVNDLLDEAISFYNGVAKDKDISVFRKLNSNSLKVYADNNMISTVLRTIISYTLECCNRGDKLELSVILKDEKTVIIQLKDADFPHKQFKKYNCEHVNKMDKQPEITLCEDFIEKNNGEIFFDKISVTGSMARIILPGKRSLPSNYKPIQFELSETSNSNDL
ncbi:sensor histidine kinase [Chondrinema litorale]|uniref:sensor histidine kinase n=1 Tax=Chondrinema litorale TaxID=2994555 RepID=UPI0025429E5E|nr:hypothetical protein [Chondrinema litorale]UZR97245.1 hypothetical protein OQ292_25430 [Chondrinema litorale]